MVLNLNIDFPDSLESDTMMKTSNFKDIIEGKQQEVVQGLAIIAGDED